MVVVVLQTIPRLGKVRRCLGPAKNEGNVMVNWTLTQKGMVIPR